MSLKPTDHNQFLDDLDAGILGKQLDHAISKVATGVVETGKKGKLVIELSFTKGVGANNVTVEHKLKSDTPLDKGNTIDTYGDKTPMFVNAKGDVSLFATDNRDMFNKALDEA